MKGPVLHAVPVIIMVGTMPGVIMGQHYRHTLEELGKQKGLLGLIFTKSQNKFQDPAKLRRLIVDLIENGVSVQANVSSANVKARSAGRSYKGKTGCR